MFFEKKAKKKTKKTKEKKKRIENKKKGNERKEGWKGGRKEGRIITRKKKR